MTIALPLLDGREHSALVLTSAYTDRENFSEIRTSGGLAGVS